MQKNIKLSYILIWLVSIACIQNIQAQSLSTNNQFKTGIIDWKGNAIGGFSKSYTDSAKCGTITLKLPILDKIWFHNTFFLKTISPSAFPDGVNIQTKCKLGKFDFKDQKDEDGILFNHQTQQWYMTDAMRNEKISGSSQLKNDLFAIKGQNADGYLSTYIEPAGGGGNGSGVDYVKFSDFCLYNKSYTKEFCGNGVSQYFTDIKDIGSKRVKSDPKLKDYTPALIKILETAKFEDDK